MALMIGGNSAAPGFTDRCRAAAEVLGPQVMLWLSSAQPGDAVRYPNCLHCVRLDNWTQGMTPAAYAHSVSERVTAWRSAIPATVFVLGNEPDLEVNHMGQDFPLYAQAMRAQFPGIRLGNPPLSVANTDAVTSVVCAAADYVFVHSYFETFAPQDMSNEAFGASYRIIQRIAAGKPVIVSEVNANPQRETTIDWTRRNQQVAQWLDQAEADGVTGACLFMPDGNAAGAWPLYDVGPEAAQEILASRAKPVPVPHPTNSPLRFKGRSVGAITQMIADGSAGETSPFLALVPTIIAACSDWNLDEAAMIAWTTSENNNATNISNTLLAAHNGAGIKYVGQPRAHDGSTYVPPVLAPTSEGSAPYCVFDNWGDFFWVLARNIVTLLPDAYEAGDLNRIAWYYTTGVDNSGNGQKHAKEILYEQFAAYPNDAPVPVPTPSAQVTGAMVVAKAMEYLGETSFADEGATIPSLVHCEEFVEVVHEALGIPRHRWYDAVQHGRAVTLITDPALFAPGMVCFWDERFYNPDGDTKIYLGNDQVIGAGSASIAVFTGWLEATGFMGMCFYDGVGVTAEQEGIPVGDGFSDDEILLLVYGTRTPSKALVKRIGWNPSFGIPTAYKALANGTFKTAKQDLTGKSVVLGQALTAEEQDTGTPGRSVQVFANGKLSAYKQADGSYAIVLD